MVNGQIAFVENAHNTTVFVKLPNSLVVPIYPITSLGDRKDITVFPIRAETKALIGGCIFIYSRSARRISFEINGNDN